MIPLPSPPTDTLYKFKAFAGLIALLVSFFVSYSETDKAIRENIELTYEIETYNLTNKIADEDNTISQKNYTADSARFMKEVKEVDERIKNGENARYLNDGKYYSPEEYKSYMLSRKDKATDKRSAAIIAWGKSQDVQRKNMIKINQRKALKEYNDITIKIINFLTGVVIAIALIIIGQGFKQWKVVQDMNDEITRLQVEKARKDLEPVKEPEKEPETEV